MAVRKLPLPLFSTKPSGLQLIPRVSPFSKQQRYALVCQPLMTFRSYSLPARSDERGDA
jgi:hypothetical protein